MRLRGYAAALLVALAAVPLMAHALEPSCGAASAVLSAPTRLLQDDAASGSDAGDSAATAHRLSDVPMMENGDQGAYYWGWLDPQAARDGADVDDWYVVWLNGDGANVMARIVSNYTMVYVQTFTLSIHAPGESTPFDTVTSAGGEIRFTNLQPGDFHFRVSTVLDADVRTCAGTPDASLGSAGGPRYLQNHGLYFGCNPICVESTT